MASSRPPCQRETKRYRDCLREQRSSGRKCTHLAKSLEVCREKWRKAQGTAVRHDGTRILPNKACASLNKAVQHCIQWKKGDESQCKEHIVALRQCMADTNGIVAKPTEGDKIWADFRSTKPEK